MNWKLAKSLTKLREQINAAFPSRDRASDGWISDQRHKTLVSDHNPNKAGVVTALDIDADLSLTENVGIIAAALQASRDPRIKYLIWNSHITQKGDITKWKPYTGKNKHTHHLHISMASDPKLYDDAGEFDLTGKNIPKPVINKPRTLKFGDIGPDVRFLQLALNIKADGSFGPKTEDALKAFQKANKLTADGKAGPQTRAKLKI